MNYKKTFITSLIMLFLTSVTFAAEKKDCSGIEKNTGSGWLKSILCKKGSDKIDSDGNFKKGSFNLFKKFKKN